MQDKKKFLRELCDNYNNEFVDCTKIAGQQSDFTKMRMILTKGNDLKRKAEDHEKDIAQIEETLGILFEKKKKLKNV